MDQMASYVAGRIAIGKIDCTVQKTTCKKFQVRGYPTLKVYRDGDFFEYAGRRDADSMIEFAEKLSQPAVTIVKSHEDFVKDVLEGSLTNVAFVAYDPSSTRSGESIEEFLASTTPLQVFGQVARKLQDKASFAMIDPSTGQNEVSKFGMDGKEPFLVRMEQDVDPVIYKGEINSMDFMDFVNQQNVALVTHLEGANFRTVGHKGKPLLIGVIDVEDTTDKSNLVIQGIKIAAKKRHAMMEEEESKYQFATMDGKKWSKFLKQFSIVPESLPQLLWLDVPKRVFCQNETFTDIESFIEGVENGTIEQREQKKQSGDSSLERFHAFFTKHMPYSLIGMVLVFVVMLYFTLSDNSDYETRYREELALRRERAAANMARRKTVKED